MNDTQNDTHLYAKEGTDYSQIVDMVGGLIAFWNAYFFYMAVMGTTDLGENYFSLPLLMVHIVALVPSFG